MLDSGKPLKLKILKWIKLDMYKSFMFRKKQQRYISIQLFQLFENETFW